MGRVYVSYSHKDSDYVRKLQEALQKQGFDIWVDDHAGYGAHSPKIIQERLDVCGAFIVVVSENSFESEWVQYEIAHAKRKGIPFFPILLGGDPWLSVDAALYVNLSDGSLPPEKFYQRLADVAAPRQGLTVPPQAVERPDTKTTKPKRSKIITGIFVTLALFALGIGFLVIRAFNSAPGYRAYRPTPVIYVFHNPPSATIPHSPSAAIPRTTQAAATQTVAAALTQAHFAQVGTANNFTLTPLAKTAVPTVTPVTTLTPTGALLFLDKGYLCKKEPDIKSPTVVTLGFGVKLPILARAANPAGWWLVEIKISFSKIDICWIEGGVVEGNMESIPVIAP